MAGFELPDLRDNPNPFVPPTYDLSGAGYEAFRRLVDATYIHLDGVLSEIYHRCWKYGISAPWGSWDTLGDPAADREQFNRLCSVLQSLHLLALHAINIGQMPESAYRWYTSDDETVKDAIAVAEESLVNVEAELGVSLGELADYFRYLTLQYTGVDVSEAFQCLQS